MRHRLALALSFLLPAAAAVPAGAAEVDPWPPALSFAGGTRLALTANFAYDDIDASGGSPIEDARGLRRREAGLTLRRPGIWDAMVYYDFESGTWLDVFARVETLAWFGRDLGRIRAGYIKVPVGLEGVTSSRAVSLMELSLPIQAIYQGRRTGVEWTFQRPGHLLQGGAYGGQDLHGDNPGTTVVLRGAWTPRNAHGDVLHLGLAGSRESPRSDTDRAGGHVPAAARLRARPEVGLTTVRLVDSGPLVDVDSVRRTGVEAIWIRGPFSLQGELLRADVGLDDGRPTYTARGRYLTGSWILTGESRPYSAGNVANVRPERPHGALEMLVRYSSLDLDDAGIAGGREHNWTYGLNWYLGPHVKLQANYVRADARRDGVRTRPDLLGVRLQTHF